MTDTSSPKSGDSTNQADAAEVVLLALARLLARQAARETLHSNKLTKVKSDVEQ